MAWLSGSLAEPMCSGIAELHSRSFGLGFKPLDQFKMFGRDIGGFAEVIDQIVEFSFLQFPLFVGCGRSAMPTRFAGQGAVSMRKLKLPATIPGNCGLQLIDFVIEPISRGRIFGSIKKSISCRPKLPEIG